MDNYAKQMKVGPGINYIDLDCSVDRASQSVLLFLVGILVWSVNMSSYSGMKYICGLFSALLQESLWKEMLLLH